MNFYKMWTILESKPYVVTGNTDPSTMARTWDRLSPQNPAQNQIDQSEVWKLVRKLSDPEANRVWQRMVVLNLEFPGVKVYLNKLDNVVRIPEIMGSITGAISAKPEFYCEPETFIGWQIEDMNRKKIKSKVVIAPPPAEYDNEDRAMLASIVVHELRHAIDFHEMGSTMGGVDYNKDMGTHIEIDMDLYARNILEARAHADQVRNLVSTLGGPEQARKVLRESILGRGLIDRLRDSMIEFADLICAKNEALEPPAIVSKIEKHDVEKAVDMIQDICESFRFGRFIRK